MNYAPVLIPTLNRFEHLKRCIDSLAMCDHAIDTELYIALDFPAKEEHWEGYNRIIGYLNSLYGFRKVSIIKRDVNYGPYKNIVEARKLVYEKYDRIIMSEDDNEFGPGFLNFVNQGLEMYQNDETVSKICGFCFPAKLPPSWGIDAFLSPAFSAWGYGEWRNKPARQCHDLLSVKRYLINPININKLYYLPYGLYGGLVSGVKRKRIAHDRCVAYNNVRFGQYCLFPTESLVKNHGHDGSGSHCHSTDYFVKMQLNTRTDYLRTFNVSGYNNTIKNAYIKHHQEFYPSRFRRISKMLKNYIRLLLGFLL